MKRISIIAIIIFISGNIEAQQKGIQFEHGLGWSAVKEKARIQHKYIFVDCYTTWCGPCRFMTDSIFTSTKIGKIMEEKFIAVQLQMDTSKNDNTEIKRGYRDAKIISEKYKITAFPSFLFFNPDGNIVHEGIGMMDEEMFLSLATNAIDTSKQYYTLVEKYRQKSIEDSLLASLASLSRELGNKELALNIAGDYMRGYLDQLPDSEFCRKKNLDFISSFYKMINSSDRIFHLYYDEPNKVDSIMHYKGYAKSYSNYVIYKEEIMPAVAAANAINSVPDWNILIENIHKKYKKADAIDNVLNGKINWYKNKKDWENYTQYLVQSVERSDIATLVSEPMCVFYLNNNAWSIFQYSNKLEELNKAISWIDVAISIEPGTAALIDTKANLLYKMGKQREAIIFEQKVISLEPKIHDFQITLEKMKQGLPTWTESSRL